MSEIDDFNAKVEEETELARGMFLTCKHLERDQLTRALWLAVITEEIGKLARCCCKLLIAVDEEERVKWVKEGERRIITASSLLRRLHENWRELPDTDTCDEYAEMIEDAEAGRIAH